MLRNDVVDLVFTDIVFEMGRERKKKKVVTAKCRIGLTSKSKYYTDNYHGVTNDYVVVLRKYYIDENTDMMNEDFYINFKDKNFKVNRIADYSKDMYSIDLKEVKGTGA